MSKTEHSPLPCCWSDVNGQDCKCARRQSDKQAIAELVEALNVLCICAIQSNLRVEFEKEIADATTLIAKHKAKP